MQQFYTKNTFYSNCLISSLIIMYRLGGKFCTIVRYKPFGVHFRVLVKNKYYVDFAPVYFNPKDPFPFWKQLLFYGTIRVRIAPIIYRRSRFSFLKIGVTLVSDCFDRQLDAYEDQMNRGGGFSYSSRSRRGSSSSYSSSYSASSDFYRSSSFNSNPLFYYKKICIARPIRQTEKSYLVPVFLAADERENFSILGPSSNLWIPKSIIKGELPSRSASHGIVHVHRRTFSEILKRC